MRCFVRRLVQFAKFVAGGVSVVAMLCSCAAKHLPPVFGDPSVQASIASKTPLQAIGLSDPKVAQAVDAGDNATLTGDCGSVISVKGTLSQILYPPNKTGEILMALKGQGKSTAGVVIHASDFPNLPDLRLYMGKELLASGLEAQGRNHPFLTASGPESLKLVQ
jgi:hypothetical protein